LHFALPAAGIDGTGMSGGVLGNAVQPVGHTVPRYHGIRLARQDEEDGLEGVLGVVMIAEKPATDAEHHGAVAPNQRVKGGLVLPPDERFQQRAVRRRRVRGKQRVTNVSKNLVKLIGCH
jgi:hypothetical protein